MKRHPIWPAARIVLLGAGLLVLAPTLACAQSGLVPPPSDVPSATPVGGSVGSSNVPGSWDPWKAGMKPSETPSVQPLAVAIFLGLADGIEEGAKGAAVGRRSLLEDFAKNGYLYRKTFKDTKDAVSRIASSGRIAAIPDKGGDLASPLGAALAAISVGDQGKIEFHPERFDGIGVAQAITNNALSDCAVAYAAEAGAEVGAQMGAWTGTPIGVIGGGLVGGIVGATGASILYNGTGKKVVDGYANAAASARSSELLSPAIAQCERQIGLAQAKMRHADFREAERLLKQVQDALCSLETELGESESGRVRELKSEALELLGQIARARLQARTQPDNGSQPGDPPSELRSARPNAATQMTFGGSITSSSQGFPHKANVTGVVDLVHHQARCTIDGAIFKSQHSIPGTFHMEWQCAYQGDDQSGAFSGSTSFRFHNSGTGRYGTPLTATVSATVRGSTITFTVTTKESVDNFTLPLQ
jgi:hypothetical protein